jgi:hypothetical protein
MTTAKKQGQNRNLHDIDKLHSKDAEREALRLIEQRLESEIRKTRVL